MAVKRIIGIALLILLSGCTVYKTQPITKIALLAPFEGQYREVGYNALYAARLAIADSGISGIDLLAIDDGGSLETASLRIKGINHDPSIAAIIAVGLYATSHDAQIGIVNTPMLIVGHWNTSPINDLVYMLTSPEIDAMVDFSGEINELGDILQAINGSEILALEQVSMLVDDISQISVFSSASLPNSDFRERYLNSAEFVPDPNLLATLTYDAANIVLQSIENNTLIADSHYEGINGTFQFLDGYWVDAPINAYRYENEQLVPVE